MKDCNWALSRLLAKTLAVAMIALIVSAQSVAQQTSSAAATGQVDRSVFASPGLSEKPTIRWWWPGGAVSDAELARELSVMHDAGFSGAEIQSFAVALPPNVDPSVYTYGSPSWMGHLQAAVDQARTLGMKIDMTLGSSWPTGGSYITDAESLKMLTVSAQLVSGSAVPYAVPGPVEPLSYPVAQSLLSFPDTYDVTKLRLIAVVAARLDPNQTQDQPSPKPTLPNLPNLPAIVYLDSTAIIDLTSAVTPAGTVNWQAPSGNWLLFAVYEGPTETHPFYGADPGALVLDHFSQNAIGAHLNVLAQSAANQLGTDFGTTLRSLFVDSAELRTELYWTEDFLSQFATRRGYQLEPFLPVLFRMFADDTYLSKIYPDAPPQYEIRNLGSRIRHDYEQTVAELMTERFYAPIRQWADAHGVGSRLQTHGSPTDFLNSYSQASIPETEGLYAGGNPSFLRLAASAGHLSGKPIVSSEVLDFPQEIFPTPALIFSEFNKHFAAGINNLVFHGFPYVYDTGFSWPGWMPFNSPYLPGEHLIGTFGSHLNDRNRFWRFMPGITSYAARAQLILRTGVPRVDIALYTGKLGYPDDPSYDPQVNRELTQGGFNYDYVNENLLQSASVVNGALLIGANRYRALVLSNIQSVSPALAAQIALFAQNGLPIVFAGDVPYFSPGYLNFTQNDQLVQQTFQQLFGKTRDDLRFLGQFQSGSALFLLDSTSLASGLTNGLGVAPDVSLGDAGSSISYVHRQAGAADYYFLASSSPATLDAEVLFTNSGGRFPEIWDVQSGMVQTANVYSNLTNQTRIQLHFNPGQAIVVGFDTVGSPVHLETTDLPGVQRDAQGNLVGLVPASGTYTVILNGGITKQVTVSGSALPPIGLPTWDLVAATQDSQGTQGQQLFQKISLQDLSSMPGLLNFAGWADYAAYVDFTNIAPGYSASDIRLVLDLGKVADVAEVHVNDKSVTTLSTSPYQIDVTDFLTSGLNKIEVAVTSALGETPAGLLGPVNLVPLHKITVPGFKPLQTSVVVTPVNYPNNTEQDMLNAIARASQLVNHVNFQWFWKTPPNTANPNGGAVVECPQVTQWVNQARSLNLAVTLQFQTFWTEVNGSYATALNAGSMPTVHVATPLAPFDTATFADPAVSSAYLNQIACLASLKPEYLVLGPEVNFLFIFSPTEWNAFLPVYAQAYALAKSISPTTQVGLSYQYDGLRRDHILNNDNWVFIRQAGPADFIGLTTYYGFSQDRNQEFPVPSAIPDDYYQPIRDVLGPNVPVVFTEIGWSSFFTDGQKTQAEFLRRMIVLLEGVQPDNITWAMLHDVNYFEGPGVSLNDSGLLASDDTPKLSWNQAMLFKNEGVMLGVVPHVFAPLPMPFSVTATPPNFPQQFTQQAGLQAIANASQVSGHVSLQFSWRDRVTGQVWNCTDIQPYTDEVHRLGLRFTLQFNTYATVASTTPGQNPTVILLNPIDPPQNDSDTGPSFSNPHIRDAFLQQMSCIAGLGADYIALGPEVNFLVGFRPDEWTVFKQVYQQAYALIKSISPSTQVGLSYQWDGMRANLLSGSTEGYVNDAGPQDFLGLTSYFSFSAAANQRYPNVTDIPADYYSLIRARFGQNAPVVFTEVGWSSFFANGLDNQVFFLNRLLLLLQAVKPVNVIWPLQYDISNYFTGEIAPLNDMGLNMNDGSPKPAWQQALWLKGRGLYTSTGAPPILAVPALPLPQ